MRGDATSRLRMWGYCLLLVALAFVQEPGRIVGDTKLDLSVDPAGFLARATQLWDPVAAFGQIQNQAYGYLWPMGPFFLLGDALEVPAWVVQRLWWSALLCLAFVGVVKVARALDIGRPWTHVVSGFAFALSAHVLTLLGPTSVEAWPTAWAPWVLLPLVHASRAGSVRRGAALSALAVAMCGGVNAVAVSAVLPLGVIWLATRERGRRLRLFAWWVLFTLLATLWWWVPLLLLGRYGVPFLDYIENAPITTLPTSLPDVLGGTSDWVAYIAPQDWAAGHLLGTTPFLLVNAAVVAGAGLAGVVRRDNPQRHFLFLAVLVGAVLVGFGYVGPLHGWWADERLALLDAELAPFRNLHKYDVVLRMALVLGLAHFLTVVAEYARTAAVRLPAWMAVMATVVSVFGLAVPTYAGQVAPTGSFEEVPAYWRATADYLDDAGRSGVALVVPASAFGDYRWGSPHDDVLQPLASRPWAVRNIIPLAQPGNVRFLDAVSDTIERGRPSATLASFLANNGVGYLVVRNDVSPSRLSGPDPVVLHQALDLSPGLTKVAEFGPTIGEDAVARVKGLRIVLNRGRQAAYRAVEVYAVDGRYGQVSAWTAASVPVVAGDPGAGLAYDAEVLDGPMVLAGDETAPFGDSPTVLTDGLRRRETAFTAVRENTSATLTARERWTLSSVVPNHRIYENQAPFETRARWVGVRTVEASSAQSDAAVLPPVRPDRSPAAALDGAPGTQWVSSALDGAVGQWWRVRLERPTYLEEVTLTGGQPIGPAVTQVELVTDVGSRVVRAPEARSSVTYALPDGVTSSLEIRAVRVQGGGPGGHFSLADVSLPGVDAERYLATPEVFKEAPDQILLTRERERPGCVVVGEVTVCDDFRELFGEERFGIRRTVALPQMGSYEVEMTATTRRRRQAAERVSRLLPVQVTTSKPVSRAVRASGLATIDGDRGTAWIASPASQTPVLRLRWDGPTALSEVAFEASEAVPGAQPEKVVLKAGDEVRVVSLVDGRGRFDELVTDNVKIEFYTKERAYSFENAQAVRLPVAVGEVRFPGAELPVVDPEQLLPLGCGTGPTLIVNGASERTRLVGSLGEIMSGEPLAVASCGNGEISLRAGANEVHATRSPVVRPEELRLTSNSGAPTAPHRVAVRLAGWAPTSRTVEVPPRTDPTLLVVNENINAGWSAQLSGRKLRPQRVNGWMQGWVLPPGGAGEVRLRFTPNQTYHAGLLAGLFALALVVVAAVVPGRRARQAWGESSAGATWLVGGTSLLAGGALAGWVGFLGMAVALLVGKAYRVPAWLGFVSGGCVALAGVVQAVVRADRLEIHSVLAQSLAVLGLVVAVAAFGANGPRFFKRRNGRSST